MRRSEDREGERNESPDGAGHERNRDGVSKRRAASERDIHPQGPMQPLFFKGNPAHAHRRWGHRDGTDILFTVVHLPPGSKWSHNHITHSQRPPILQVQSHTHTHSYPLFLCFFHTYSHSNTQFHTRTVNMPINKSCHGQTDSGKIQAGQIPAWLIYLNRKMNTEYHRYTDDNMKNVPSLTSILSATVIES